MRILMANNSLTFRGGVERVMLDEATWLRGQGHEVAFFGPIEVGREHEIAYADFMPIMPNYQEQSPLKKLVVAKNFIYNKATADLFLRFVKEFKPDIVHGHSLYGGLTTSILDICEQLAIPIVLTLHDYKLICPSYRMLRNGKPCTLCLGGKFYHCATTRCHKDSFTVSLTSTVEAYFNQTTGKYLKAKCLLVPSAFMLNMMKAGGIPPEKIHLLPNGVALPFPSEAGHRENFILYAGRLSEEKGVLTLIEAMRGLDIELRIAGDGPMRPTIEAILKQGGMNKVHLEGHLTSGEMDTLFRKAAAVVVPSEWYENASMVILETMAQGTPIIASSIGGIPEQIEDGKSGLLFQPGDGTELRRALMLLMNDTELRIRLGKAARRRISESFSLDQHGSHLLKEYEAAILQQ